MHPTPEATREIESMYVQSATGVVSSNGTMTLRGLCPSILYFSDRPERVVGHLTPKQFVDLWGEGENSFAKDPPNAVLAFLEPSHEYPEDVVVVLRDPRLDGNNLTYSVEVLEETLPPSAGGCSLFIDPAGRPLPPVSVAGVHRRARRRAHRALYR